MKKKVKARHQIEKVTITFIPNEENIEKAAEVYAKAVIKMVKEGKLKLKPEKLAK